MKTKTMTKILAICFFPIIFLFLYLFDIALVSLFRFIFNSDSIDNGVGIISVISIRIAFDAYKVAMNGKLW